MVVNASTSFIQVEDESRTELFPSNVLADLDLTASPATFSPALSVTSPGETSDTINSQYITIIFHNTLYIHCQYNTIHSQYNTTNTKVNILVSYNKVSGET